MKTTWGAIGLMAIVMSGCAGEGGGNTPAPASAPADGSGTTTELEGGEAGASGETSGGSGTRQPD